MRRCLSPTSPGHWGRGVSVPAKLRGSLEVEAESEVGVWLGVGVVTGDGPGVAETGERPGFAAARRYGAVPGEHERGGVEFVHRLGVTCGVAAGEHAGGVGVDVAGGGQQPACPSMLPIDCPVWRSSSSARRAMAAYRSRVMSSATARSTSGSRAWTWMSRAVRVRARGAEVATTHKLRTVAGMATPTSPISPPPSLSDAAEADDLLDALASTDLTALRRAAAQITDEDLARMVEALDPRTTEFVGVRDRTVTRAVRPALEGLDANSGELLG